MPEGTIVFDLVIPSVWPPEDDVLLLTGLYEGNDVTLMCSRDKRLLVNVISEKNHLSFTSQPLDLPNFPKLKMALGWGGDDSISLAINGNLISSSGGLLKIDASSEIQHRRERINFIDSLVMDNNEELLISTLKELQERIFEPSSYDLLMTSGLLRKLILDSSPLLHLVNRSYKIKVRFPVVKDRVIPKVNCDPSFSMRNVYTDFFNENEVDWLKLDEFLAVSIIEDDKFQYSIRDVILLIANKCGGIHFDQNSNKTEKRLLELSKRFNHFNIDSCFIVLCDIAWSVLTGIKPLIDAITHSRHN